jgi:hypothetical protein
VAPIVASVEIDRPAEEVFAYATDPTRFSEWQLGVIDGHMDSAATLQVGDRCLTTRRIGLADRPVTSELVCYEPPHQWSVRGVDGPIRAIVEVMSNHDRHSARSSRSRSPSRDTASAACSFLWWCGANDGACAAPSRQNTPPT